MKSVSADNPLVVSATDLIPNLNRFSHSAMATTYEIFIPHKDSRYAEQAAHAAFSELDKLESELSRFIENSDINRINNLPANQPLVVGLDTFDCLKHCLEISCQTEGAFDITIGFLYNCWRNDDKSLRKPSRAEISFARKHTGSNLLKLDESSYSVELITAPIKIDLGAFGKGYAVDRMADMLGQWSIDTALIHGGFSSVFAIGCPSGQKGWPITLSYPRDSQNILSHLNLSNYSFSGSGLQKGPHIINPRTGKPVENRIAAWSCAPSAALADALSTAFMVMSATEVKQFCAAHSDILAMLIDKKGKIVRFGNWDQFII